jgi:hypothetical protein
MFQKPDAASADVARPRSPIPPERASGEILKKGTAVVTTLIVGSWAFKTVKLPQKNKTPAVSFKTFGRIRIVIF